LQVGQNPQKGSLTLNQNGSFTYVPGPNENGTDTFSYYVTDGLLNSNIATATINLGAINDAPVAQNRMESTMEDVSLTGETMLATDVDGDPLTYRITVPPANGTLTPNLLTGSYTYQPNANFNGSDVFRYIATDGTADSNEATVTIAVTAFNDKPIVGDVTLNIDEDETKSGFIVGTDVETPASSLVFSRVTSGCSGPTKGQVTVNANGSYTYDPNSNATGSDTFCYRAYDGNKYSDMGTATVNIAALNDAPRASDTTFNINEDNSLSNGQLSATDVESSSLSYTIVEAGSSTAFNTPNGRVTSYSRTTGRVSYTPNANFFGTETLHFRVSDGQLDSEEAVITINVRSVNDRPVAVAASFSGVGTIAEQLQGTDVENGTAVSYRLSSAPPPPVSVVVSPTGAFTATVPPGQVGPSSFQFVVNDGNMDSASVTVNLIFQ